MTKNNLEVKKYPFDHEKENKQKFICAFNNRPSIQDFMFYHYNQLNVCFRWRFTKRK